jgi:putative membrane protein
MRFVLKMVVAAFALIGIAYVSEGSLLAIAGDGLGEQFLPALLAAVLLAVVNATIGKIAKFVLNAVTLPIGCITLGLSTLVIALFINTAMFYVVEAVVDGFSLVGFWPTVLAALIMSVVTAVTGKIIDDED